MKPDTAILLVDDEPNVRLSYRAALETEGYHAAEAGGGEQAMLAMGTQEFALVVLDVRLPGMDGLATLSLMRASGYRTPVVFVTAHGEVPEAVRAMKLGAIDFLQKPLTPTELRRMVQDVLQRHASPLQAPPLAADPVWSAEAQFDRLLQEAKRQLNLQQFAPARAALAEAMALNPLSAEAFNLAGVLFELLQEPAKARQFYAQALKLQPGLGEAQENFHRLAAETASVGARGSGPHP